MPYVPDWQTLAEAVARLEDAGEREPFELLRRACADANVRARGMIDGAYHDLGPEWWHTGATIDAPSGRISKGPTSRQVPIRALSKRGDSLGPSDYQRITVRGNLAEGVQVWRQDVERVCHAATTAHAVGRDPPPLTVSEIPDPHVAGRLGSANGNRVPDLSTWTLVDVFTVEQAACLWVNVDPSTNNSLRPTAETSRIAPITQMLFGSIGTGDLRADSSKNVYARTGDYSRSLVSRDDLRSLAAKKNQRPSFLFDTLLQDQPVSGSVEDDETVGKPSKGGRPPEYDWDEFTIEIIRIADLDSLPYKQSELIERMLQWCEDTWGRQPSESNVKGRISRIYNGLGRGQKLPST